jgi:hypothetical protein
MMDLLWTRCDADVLTCVISHLVKLPLTPQPLNLSTKVSIFGRSSRIRKGFAIASSMPAASACFTCSLRAFALTARMGILSFGPGFGVAGCILEGMKSGKEGSGLDSAEGVVGDGGEESGPIMDAGSWAWSLGATRSPRFS